MGTFHDDSLNSPKLGLVLLVKEILSQIDDVHAFRKDGLSGNISMYLLKEMTDVLHELDEETKQMYFEILVTLATSDTNQPRHSAITEKYAQSTKPIKQSFVEKMRKQLLKTGS